MTKKQFEHLVQEFKKLLAEHDNDPKHPKVQAFLLKACMEMGKKSK